MKTHWTVDIETKALPESIQLEIEPEFEAGKNLKDQDKIAAAITEKRRAWLEQAPLEAVRGEVLAIGMIIDDEPEIIHGMLEADILSLFRLRAAECSDRIIVGHNLLGFDLPFLCRRMWRHSIDPPKQWLDCSPYRAKFAFDTMLAWSCGNREQRISLDLLAWHFGLGRKNGTGAAFAKLYETDRESALAYLRNDLELTEKVYLRMNKS